MRTLLDGFEQRDEDGLAFVFSDQRRTWGQLHSRALRVCGALQRSTDPGDRALLAFVPGLDFIDAFLGCLLAGRIAVPVYPPDPRRGSEVIEGIARDCGARVVLGLPLPGFEHVRPADPGLPTPTEIAFLQYTSGSTGAPKGVVVTHDNLLHNQAGIQAGAQTGPGDVIVSWLPTYHDMGLIGTVLHALFIGAPCHLLSPLDFLQRPRRWLELLGEVGGTYSLAPTFAYGLCTRKVRDLDGLDLSSWRYAGVGAEPVRAEVLRAFQQHFASVGFAKAAFAPLYGLAENTVGVTAKPDPTAPPRITHFPDHGELVSMGGWHWGNQELRVVDGEIQLKSASVCAGYWGDRDAFGPWLRTGDLGFVHEGELYVIGRRDDTIIVRGRNYAPHDLEASAERVPLVRAGCSAAFELEGKVVLVYEGGAPRAAVEASVRARDGVSVVAVRAPRGGVPKTSSGKVRRSACREAYQAGAWGVDAATVARILGLPLRPDAAFSELGLDSADLVEATATLADALKRELPPTLLYDHGTLRRLAGHLSGADPEPLPRRSEERPMIGVAGVGCRLPGGIASAAELWEALLAGLDAVGPPPRSEAPDGVGAYLDDVFGFDHEFFGISAREARAMDPQQRLLLEVSWQALEDAGIDPTSLRGQRVGVFIGASGFEHGAKALEAENPGPYSLTGSLASSLSGRLAWQYDLRGPAVTVDTACSSSLVAVHQAVQALYAGECDLALAGGVNVLLSEATSKGFEQLGVLSPTGRCRPFSAHADGIVRGEGCVLFVLRRGTGRAHIVGSAVNQDGRTAAPTAPSGASQQEILQRIGVQVAYVEAHGTGTPLGDPIEARAIEAVHGQVQVGSVKSNFGHLEAAAGALGLAKAVLMLEHGQIPRTLHCQEVNRLVHLDVVREVRPLHGAVGVSAFGFAGTNGHVVVDVAPREPAEAPLLAFVSGATRSACEANARAISGIDASSELRALARRAQHRYRICFTPGRVPGPPRAPRRLAWVFPGQGDPPGTQVELFDAQLERVDRLLALGARPDVVLGYSLGQLVAAVVAGVFSRPVARALVQVRQRLMTLPGAGAMLMVRGRPPLPEGVELAVDKGRDIVLSGPEEAIEAAQQTLSRFPTVRLAVADAFHSSRMDPAVDPFIRAVERAVPRPPRVPIIAHGDPSDPTYWGRHLREPVLWKDALDQVSDAAILDVMAPLESQLATAWEAGQALDLAAFMGEGDLAHLPGYAFERPSLADPAGWVWQVRPDPAGRVWIPVVAESSPLKAGGRYLITGGTGGLGTVLGTYLEQRYAAEVVRIGRRDLDLTDAAACRAWATGKRFDAVFHLAGTTSGTAKREGVLHLQELDTPLWVLFSSISGVLDLDEGLEAYAESNRWLDRWAAGHAGCVSIAWCPWNAPGMAEQHARALSERGIRPIDPDTALQALEVALGSGLSNVVVLHREASAGPLPEDYAVRIRAAVERTAGRSVADEERLAEVGIDSVSALGLLKDLEASLGRQLPSTFLYENDTIGKVVAALRLGRELEVAPRIVDSAQGLPLTPVQQAFVVSSRFFSEQANSVVIACDTDIDVEAALERVLARHPILSGQIRDNRLWLGAASVGVEHVHRVEDDGLAREPFTDALFRVVTDGRRLALAGHHAIVDAQSMAIVLGEMVHASTEPQPPLWSEVVPHLLAPASGETKAWWKAHLQPVPIYPLPWTDDPRRSPRQGCSFVRRSVPVAPLLRRSEAYGVTLPVLVLSLWGHALYEQTGLDPWIRVALGRRTARVPGIEGTVGSFADGLPLKLRLVRDERKRAQAASRGLADLMARSDISSLELARLVRGDPSAPAGLSPFGFSFPTHALPMELAGLETLKGSTSTAFVRLSLLAWRVGDRLDLTFCRSVSHLDGDWLEAHADRLLTALASPAEPCPQTLHGAVLARLVADPARLVAPGHTAADLDVASARVAASLPEPPGCVGVVGLPSFQSVAAILGVLRAGGTVVPIDARWPEARRDQLLTRAGVSATVEGIPACEPHYCNEPSQTAYLWFTSGSSGSPKGVRVSHGALLDFLDQVEKRFGIDQHDVFLHSSSIAFDASLRQIFSPLLCGARMVFATPEQLRDPEDLATRITGHGVTVFNGVPSLFGRLPPLPTVRLAWVGGEALPPNQVDRWYASTDAPLFNVYGPTEGVVNATVHQVSPGDTAIGYARAGVDVYLLDGEIVVGGSIATGYLDGESGFEDHPQLGRIYRTGDLAEQRADGALVFRGRRDRQVQISGHRVELAEIERVLGSHPEVRGVSVSDVNGRLVATVEGPTELRDWCAERLPAFMVPSRFIQVGGLPRGPTGKLARGLAAVWQNVLQLRVPPGPHDDFFSLGGDSLRILDVADAVGVRPMKLYAAPRFEDMERVVAASRPLINEEVSATEVERGFLTVHARGGRPTSVARLPWPSADPDRLQARLDELVRRHPRLRSAWVRGQREGREARIRLQVEDLRRLGDRLDWAREQLWEIERATRFDPEDPPLVRARLCLLPEGAELLLTADHLVCDAWSTWILARELLHGVPAGESSVPAEPARVEDRWWRDKLADLPSPPRSSGQGSYAFDASGDFQTVLSACFSALAEALGSEDLCVATAVSGRSAANRDVVGAYAWALPVRVRSLSEVTNAFADACSHSDASLSSIVAAGGPEIGRFFLTWLQPPDDLPWAQGRYAFATESTATELMIAVTVQDGLAVRVYGSELAGRVGPLLQRKLCRVEAAVVGYGPPGMALPIRRATVVETVSTRLGRSELVLLPLSADALPADPSGGVSQALEATTAPVVSLAGMLPSLCGLCTHQPPGRVLTTGHAATVAAMVLTVEKTLAALGRAWQTSDVGIIGFGSIGRSTLALLQHRHGQPRSLTVEDPRLGTGERALGDLILGASSGGATLVVSELVPGTVVIDDSFPPVFDHEAARRRMAHQGDVLLLGGGMLDAGPLHRESAFPQAVEARRRYGDRWLAGCHAEAVLVAAYGLGPTTGTVSVERALQLLAAVDKAGWRAPPLHLGTWLVPEALVERVRNAVPFQR